MQSAPTAVPVLLPPAPPLMPYATRRGIVRYHTHEVMRKPWYGLLPYVFRCHRKCCRWRWYYISQFEQVHAATLWMDRIPERPSSNWLQLRRHRALLEEMSRCADGAGTSGGSSTSTSTVDTATDAVPGD